MSHDATKNLNEVMRKYDRESNTRAWEGKPKIAVQAYLAAFAIFEVYVTLFGTMLDEVRLTSFVGGLLIAGFLIFPSHKHEFRVNYVPWYDWVIMALGAVSFFYFCFNANTIVQQLPALKTYEVVLGVIGILALFELCRRSTGVPIMIVAGVFIAYALYYYGIKRGLGAGAFKSLVCSLFYKKTGILSTPINVCSKYIAVFIIFGAFLERTGISDFFIQLANSLAGSSAGGPAKVAVISSALCGMVSGSSVGNTVTTGSVTIPMMKKTGYRGEFAGAVEAAASTGGQIMPPIMGAAAFLMVDYVSLPYSNIVVRAILPAVLYFTGIFICVHLEAKKSGLQGVPRRELPPVMPLLKKTYLLLPLVILVYLVSSGSRTMAFAAAIATVTAIVVSMFSKETRMTPKKFFEALAGGTQGCISVGVACCVAGIVAGCLTMTGLANQILHAIIGTLEITFGAMLISIPIGLMCAVYLVEYSNRGKLAQVITLLVDVMSGIPSIVAGLFAFSMFTILIGPGTINGFEGSVALSLLMLPTVVKSSEEMLKIVPHDLREASYALGVTKQRTITKIVLRTALPGIVSGAILAVARVIGETAPLLMTAGYIASTNVNLFSGQMTTLPVYVYQEYSKLNANCPANASAACVTTIPMERAWAAALVLILIVLILNLIGRLVAKIFAVKSER
mgnify:CR=1 FL=1